MPFTIRPYRRFPVPCVVTYNGEILSLTVTLPNEQRIEIPEAVVRWSGGQEFGIETGETPKHTQARLIDTCDDW
jgi:hypothetical protein